MGRSTRRRRRGVLALVAVAGLALAACSPEDLPFIGGGGDDDSSRRDRGDQVAEQIWTVAEEGLVGELSATEEVLLSYVDDGDSALSVVAWDGATGEELWRDGATLDYTGLTFPFSPAVMEEEGYVSYLRPGPGTGLDTHELVVVDARTGDTLASAPMYATMRPYECSRGGAVCLTGESQRSAEEQVAHRFDPENGRLVVDKDAGLPEGMRWLGEDGLYTNIDNSADERLGYSTGGMDRWSHGYGDLFNGSEFSLNNGARWAFDDEVHLGAEPSDVTGYIAYTAFAYAANSSRNEAASRSTAIIDPEDGTILWQGIGYSDCGFSSEIPTRSAFTLCRWNAGTGDARSLTDWTGVDGADIDVVALDPDEGEIRWEAPFDAENVGGGLGQSFIQVPGEVVMLSQGDLVILDTATGEVSEVDGDDRFLCTAGRGDITLQTEDGPAYLNSGESYYPCDRDRDPEDEDEVPLRLLGGGTQISETLVALPLPDGPAVYDIADAIGVEREEE